MHFSDLSSQLQELEKTNSRLEMMYKLADLYKVLPVEEIKIASYLMQGSLVPAYLSLEFQLSVKMVIRALAQINQEVMNNSEEFTATAVDLFGEIDDSTDKNSIQIVTKLYKQTGDIGEVAQEIKEKFADNENVQLSILEVHEKLSDIARDGGVGSQDRKVQKLVKLFKSLDPISAKYVARIIIGKLRLGFSAMTILDALSWAVVGSKDHRKVLETSYQKRADIGELSQVYLELAKEIQQKDLKENKKNEINSEQLAEKLSQKYEVSVGIPVVPALCQRLNTAKEIIEKMDSVIAEPKYDGLRIQIHYSKNGFTDEQESLDRKDEKSTVRAFTRNLEEVTHMFPELLEVAKLLKTDNCILDAEAIGYNPKTEELLPFQETITRKRKHNIEDVSNKVPIRFYVFDVLYSGNNSFLQEKLQIRKDLLRGLFIDNKTIKFTKYIKTSDPIKLKEFHEQQLGGGLEGAVMKQVDSIYQGGRKGWSWVKIKEVEGNSGKLKDTLDLVVMGYYYGRGKRSKFGIGAFLVGVLNEKQQIKTIAKIGTGLKDDQFKEFINRTEDLIVSEKPELYEVEKSLAPDVWTSPELVVEIAADEITKSPTHSAKVALRFPRLVKFRDDKKWTDATTIKELENF